MYYRTAPGERSCSTWQPNRFPIRNTSIFEHGLFRLFLISRYFMGKNHESETFRRFYLSVQYLQLDPELALSFVLIFQS